MKTLTKSTLLIAAAALLALASNSAQAGGHSKHGGHHNHHNSHRNFHHNSHHNVHRVHSQHHHVQYHAPVRHYTKVVVAPIVRTPVPNGATITISGRWCGQFTHVFMSAQHQKFPVKVIASSHEGLTIQLPPLHLHDLTNASIYLVSPHGTLLDRTPLVITPVAPELHQ